MEQLDIPENFSALVREIADRRRESDRERARSQRDARADEMVRQRGRDEARPDALRIMQWAQAVAKLGVLDPLDATGLVLYEVRIQGGRRRLYLRPDGTLRAEHVHYRGGGAKMIRSADALLRRVDTDVITELAALIDAGSIWKRLTALNG